MAQSAECAGPLAVSRLLKSAIGNGALGAAATSTANAAANARSIHPQLLEQGLRATHGHKLLRRCKTNLLPSGHQGGPLRLCYP